MKQNINQKTLVKLKNQLYVSVSSGDFRGFQIVCNTLLRYDYDLFELIKIAKIDTIKNKFNIFNSDSLLPESSIQITKKNKINSIKNEDVTLENLDKIKFKNYTEDTIKDSLLKKIAMSSNILYLYRNEIKDFTVMEEKFYVNLLNNDFDNCLIVLNEIDTKICFSSWSQLLRLSVYYLKVVYSPDCDELKKEFNDIFDEMFDDSKQAFNSLVIHLHYYKLSDMIDSNTDNTLRRFTTRLMQWKEEFSKSDKPNIKIFLEELDDNYFEKIIISPLDEEPKLFVFNKMLEEGMKLSIIDLYKAFSLSLIELQINEEDYFNNYIKSKTSIINRILKISPNINIIKFENIANEEEALKVYLKNIKELNLFDVFECFLKGDFHKVIKDSIKLLVDKPYVMDLIYFIVHSLLYLDEKPSYIIKMNQIKEKSLLYDIIESLFYILGTHNKEKYLERIKKILLCFGNHVQWNIYLNNLISDFLCKNNYKKTKNFSNTIKYSYYSHPRAFFRMTNKQRIIFLKEIKENYSITHDLFESCLTNKKNIENRIYPSYREEYIKFRSDKNKSSIIYDLYNQKSEMPYFYKCKVITSYVEILINEQKYQKALEIIVKNHLEKFMPLCMFNYKNNNTYIFNNVDSSPYYTLLCILDNPEDTILIHYAMKNYLLSIDKACKKPSHIKSFLPNIENLEINIELLKRIIKHNYLSEFLVSLKSRKEIIQEQLELINIIKIYDKNYDIDNELKNKFDEELRIIENTNFVNEHKISINKDKLKISCFDGIKLFFENYKESEYGEDKYEYYKYVNQKGVTYQSSNFYREEKIENMFRFTLKEILFSNIGVINSINENIIHNHLNDTLRQPLLDEKIFAQISNDKYEISYWNTNEPIKDKVIEFSKQVNTFLELFKNQIIDYSGNGFFNFNYENLFTEIKFYKFIEMEKQLEFENLEPEVYFEQIIQYVLEQLREEIKLGRERLKENLENSIKNIFSILDNIQNTKFLEHLNHAKQNIENNSIKNIVSWFKLNEALINNDFLIIEVINTLKKEYPEISNIDVVCDDYKPIKGQYFINFHRIYYIILHNIIKHSNFKNNSLNVSFKIYEDQIEIINKNKYRITKKDTRQNGTGLDFLNNNLITINEANCYSKKFENLSFTIILKLCIKDIFNA